MKQVLILGDSHVVALGHALERNPGSQDLPALGRASVRKLFSFPTTLRAFHRRRDNDVMLTDAGAARELAEVIGAQSISGDDGRIFVFSIPYTTTILLRNPVWRRFSPWAVCERPRQPLSVAVIEQIVLYHFRYSIQFLTDLSEAGVRCFALHAPPPRRDDPKFGRSIEARVGAVLHATAVQVVQRALQARGVESIDLMSGLAASILSNDGFLPPEFHAADANDFHHANARFGQEMLSAIDARIRRLDD